jgi:hypothetical protein
VTTPPRTVAEVGDRHGGQAYLSEVADMRKLSAVSLAALMLMAVAVVQPPTRASAGASWCWGDPVLVIDGKTVHIDVGFPLDQRSFVTTSTLTVTVPANVTASLNLTNAANPSVKVTLVASGTWSGAGPVPVQAEAVVHATQRISTGLKAWQASGGPLAESYGTSGTPMTIRFGVQ